MTDWLYSAAEATWAYLRPRPHHNLRQYAGAAVLPKMDLAPGAPAVSPPGFKSHKNRVFAQHEIYRLLEEMEALGGFEAMANEFNEHNMPMTRRGESDDDAATGSRISVPAPGYNISDWTTGQPATLKNIVEWVKLIPLMTVRRMMHLVYPETLEYGMEECLVPAHDDGVIQWIKWAPNDLTMMDAGDLRKPVVMILVQPPWMLSPKDLEIFAATTTFPDPDPTRLRKPMTSAERLWAKLYDVCSHNRSHFFVVTTYWGWVFGAFSEERTRAWTSSVVTRDSKNPTVLECLFFWLASATVRSENLPYAWTIPKVSEPIYMDSDADSDSDDDVPMLPSEPSESAWDARSAARSHTPSGNISDDGERTVILELTGEATVDSVHRRPHHGFGHDDIAGWLPGVQAKKAHGGGYVRSSSPTASQVTQSSTTTHSSVSTVRDFAHDDRRAGNFLAGGPSRLR